MKDQEVLQHINELVAEEHQLLEKSEQAHLDAAEHRCLQAVQVSLDQCWDLLRQRRAKREFGKNPDTAKARPTDAVEKYVQ